MKRYYQILGISPKATSEEIRAAWLFSIKAFHPDKFSGSSPQQQRVAHERTKAVNEAYTTLSDRIRRSDYDRQYARKAGTESEPPKPAPAPTPAPPPAPAPAGVAPAEPAAGHRFVAAVFGIALCMVLAVIIYPSVSPFLKRTVTPKPEGTAEVALAASKILADQSHEDRLARRDAQADEAFGGHQERKIPDKAILGISETKITRNTDAEAETSLTLRVGVKMRGNSLIDPTKVTIQAYFYDTVDNNKIALTDAEVNYEWITQDHDWKNTNPEILAVSYLRLKREADSGRNFATTPSTNRNYAGYQVRVYYRGQLQDVCAWPEQVLLKFPAPQSLPQFPDPISSQGDSTEQQLSEAFRTDYIAGLNLARKLADARNPIGIFALGWCYEKGAGVSVDRDKAIEHYDKAATQGYWAAQLALGRIFDSGQGVPVDHAKAYQYYKSAADQGSPDAMLAMGLLLARGADGVERNSKKAIEMFAKSGEAGNATAWVNLGWEYEEGVIVRKDLEKAVGFYLRASELGEPTGDAYLAACYASGKGVKRHPAKALRLYRRAVLSGRPNALNNFAWFLATNTEAWLRDGKEAVNLATRACEISEWKTSNFISTLAAAYAETSDFEKAIELQERALELNSPEDNREQLMEMLKLFRKHRPYRE